MKSKHVGIGRFCKIGSDPVDDRMRYFMSDDVVRQTREDALARQIGARANFRSRSGTVFTLSIPLESVEIVQPNRPTDGRSGKE